MPAWIHERAEHILAKNPSMPKSMAFALATQQSHAKGKTPKGYGTVEGKVVAKAKYDQPKGTYESTANPQNLKTPKLSDEPKTRWTGSRLIKASMVSFVDEWEKMALAERVVRLAATDVARTPRLFMRKRSPAELAALQEAVERGWNKRVTDPILRKALPAIERIPEHPVTKPLKAYLRFGTKQIAKDPIGIGALQFLPATGATEAYIGGKIALEKLIDKLAPIRKIGFVEKRGFGVSEFSGPLGYGGFKQESYIPPFVSPPLKTAGPPSQRKKLKTAAAREPIGMEDLPPPRGEHSEKPKVRKAPAKVVEPVKLEDLPPPRGARTSPPAPPPTPHKPPPPPPPRRTRVKPKPRPTPAPSAAKPLQMKKPFPWKIAVPAAAGIGALTLGAHYLDKRPLELQKKKKAAAAIPSAFTPAGMLSASRRVGQPKLTAPSGPSIAQIAKPKGFGTVLPGAGKGRI